ncbi:MAG: CBS domain-containing protein [Anaerolineales bacterium]|nr:CBS domain-containing protein [Anaerolineales bacterium]MCX7754140.1 CBS domain-containing protein [Anaerolineales bacterium]MDW8278054.1 CBS domain-containing protein [Anaerolineales bacterium]
MPTVRTILEEKGDTIYAVDCSETVYRALEVMAEHNIGAVLVSEGDRYVGIFTERDYARRIILKGHDSRTTPLKDIMTRELVTVTPDTSAEQCMALMTRYHIRHLPVVEEGRIVGLVSIGDVVKQVIANRESTIAELENYILGTGYGR